MKSFVILLLQSCILNTFALLCNHMNKKGESSPSQCRGYCTSISAITNGHSIKATYCVPSAECLATKSRSQLVGMGARICEGVTQSIGDPSAITHCKAIVCQEDNCNNFKTIPGNLKTDCQISQCKLASCHNKAVGPTTAAVPTVANTVYSTTPPAMTYEVTEIITAPKKIQTQPQPIMTEKSVTEVETLPPNVVTDPVEEEKMTRQRFLPTKPETEAPKAPTNPVTQPKHVTQEEIIITEEEIIVTKPEIIVTKEQMIITEPEIIVTKEQMIITEQEILITEPEIHITEPNIIVTKAPHLPSMGASDPVIVEQGTMSLADIETVSIISTVTTNPKFVPTEQLVTSLDDIAHLLVTLTAAMNSTHGPDYVVHITTQLPGPATGDTIENDSEFDYSNGETMYEKEGLLINNAALNGSQILPSSSSSLTHLSALLLALCAVFYIS